MNSRVTSEERIMCKVKNHRGWEYWLDAGTHRYVAAKFIDGEQAEDSVEGDTIEEVLEQINAAEDATLVFADIEEEISICPACYGEGVSLGALGATAYHRCRQCGLVS
jgi:tRNA(Ile2) C34 agmatinyltransferase TiaS